MSTYRGNAKGQPTSWWKRLGRMVVQAGRDLMNDNGFEWSAAVAFYALLSLFPLLLLGAYLASVFVDMEYVMQQGTRLLSEVIPTGAGRVEALIRQVLVRRDTVGLISGLGLLWTGTRVFGTLTKALNIAYDVDEVYGFWKRRLVELAILCSVGAVFVLALILPWVLRFSWEIVGNGGNVQGVVVWAATDLAPGILLVLAFFALYRFAPRRRPSWRAALPGAVLVAGLFLLMRVLFVAYISRFANYSDIYGSIAVVVTVVIWIWLATVLLLFGGEIVSHTQDMIIEGRSAEEVNERHLARSSGQQPKQTPHRSRSF